jgi:hypothetical protein
MNLTSAKGENTRISYVAALVVSILVSSFTLSSGSPRINVTRNIDDTARFFAGLSTKSRHLELEQTREWRAYAATLNSNWEFLQRHQIRRIGKWAHGNLTQRTNVVFYMFSGPDFPFANALYDNADIYVLTGLEPVGQVPNLSEMSRGSLSSTFNDLNLELERFFRIGFFTTEDLRSGAEAGKIVGALPIIMIFLARTGNSISDVSYLNIDSQGNPSAGSATSAIGVKIEFFGRDRHSERRTVYYFHGDLSNKSATVHGLLEFCSRLGSGGAVLKSSAYLTHSDEFSQVRTFLLMHSATIVQDDSGIPLRYFEAAEWQVEVFGRYRRPVKPFADRSQPDLKRLYAQSVAKPIDFGFGYRWRPTEAGILKAVKRVTEKSDE